MHNHRTLDSEVDANLGDRLSRPTSIKKGGAAAAGPASTAALALLRAAGALALGAVLATLGSCTTPGSSFISCHTVNDCTAASTPICDAETLLCRACNAKQSSDDTACTNGHPDTPRCGPTGTCVACLTNADCPDKTLKPACRNYTCGPCQQGSDCVSFICSNDGSCAQISEVAFINNKNGACQGNSHAGSPTDPHCQIKDALAVATPGSKALISVAPSTVPYDAVNVTASTLASVSITGASSELGSVVIQGNNGEPAVAVGSTTNKITVSLRNLDLAGAIPSSRSVVECSGKVDLSIISSRVHDGGVNGIDSNDCMLTVDAVRIYNTRNIGLWVRGATYPYAISNVVVWRNDATGIAFGNGSNGTLRFATVVNNGIPGNNKPSGIDCGSLQNTMVEYSIVFDNISRPPNGTSYTDLQLNNCKLNQVVTNDTHAVDGVLKTQIDFVNASGSTADQMDLRLRADSAADRDCCIDKVSSTGGVSHDVDFLKRPAPTGGAADIGAFEIQP